jgi:hypothetical protein
VPFSIFPSTYREAEPQESVTTTSAQVQFNAAPDKAGREGRYSSSLHASAQQLQPAAAAAAAPLEEVRYTREEERYRRPGIQQEFQSTREEFRYVACWFL